MEKRKAMQEGAEAFYRMFSRNEPVADGAAASSPEPAPGADAGPPAEVGGNEVTAGGIVPSAVAFGPVGELGVEGKEEMSSTDIIFMNIAKQEAINKQFADKARMETEREVRGASDAVERPPTGELV